MNVVQETQALLDTNLGMAAADGASRWVAQDFIDIYFQSFHPTWPFLHRGTFEISNEPCILVQSMVMIGLWIKGDEQAVEKAMTFHRKLYSAIKIQRSHWYISESAQHQSSSSSNKVWPMATYQGILLQLIFSVLIAEKQEMATMDLNLRFQLPSEKYELLTSLVATCRRLGMFSYLNMLAQHAPSAPIALVWVSVEEVKRFGLALYKLCRLCASTTTSIIADHSDSATGSERVNGNPGLRKGGDLLTLQDLDFCMPDSDEVWNTPSAMTGSDYFRNSSSSSTGLQQHVRRDNRDPDCWISQSSWKLHDARVNFDWI